MLIEEERSLLITDTISAIQASIDEKASKNTQQFVDELRR